MSKTVHKSKIFYVFLCVNIAIRHLTWKNFNNLCFIGRLFAIDYFIDIDKLDNVSNFTDLGVMSNPKLNFGFQIQAWSNKTKPLLGRIKRRSYELNDAY